MPISRQRVANLLSCIETLSFAFVNTDNNIDLSIMRYSILLFLRASLDLARSASPIVVYVWLLL